MAILAQAAAETVDLSGASVGANGQVWKLDFTGAVEASVSACSHRLPSGTFCRIVKTPLPPS